MKNNTNMHSCVKRAFISCLMALLVTTLVVVSPYEVFAAPNTNPADIPTTPTTPTQPSKPTNPSDKPDNPKPPTSNAMDYADNMYKDPVEPTGGILAEIEKMIMGMFKSMLKSPVVGAGKTALNMDEFVSEQVKAMGYMLPNDMSTIANTNIPFASVFNTLRNVSTYMSPLGYSILALVYLIKMLKLLRDSSGGSAHQTPYVEQIFWLWFQFAILKTVLDNSVALSGMLFNVSAEVAQHIANAGLGHSASAGVNQWIQQTLGDIDLWFDGKLVVAGKTVSAPTFDSMGAILTIWLITNIMYYITIIIQIVITITVFGRWLQLFIYLQFAPVMFAFLGIDETKNMAIGYMKSIFSIGVGMLITLLLVMSLPAVYVSQLQLITIPNLITNSINGFVGCIAIAVIYILALKQSGTWAKEIIGG